MPQHVRRPGAELVGESDQRQRLQCGTIDMMVAATIRTSSFSRMLPRRKYSAA